MSREKTPGKIVTYGKSHMDIVQAGVDAIKEVLFFGSEAEKESMVFCLDRYLDPYFGYKLPCQNEIIALLQECLFRPNPTALKEDILHMLGMYAACPLAVLEQRCCELEAELQPEAKRIFSER